MNASPDWIRFERIRLPSGILLNVNWTPKLKTILLKADFTGNLDSSVTQKALIPMVLRRGTRNFPDMKTIHRHLEGLYGASLVSDVSKVGEWHAVKFRLEVVNERFLPGSQDVLRDALSFLNEFLHDPKLINGSLDEEYLSQEKHNLRKSIESLVDNKAHYALEQCLRTMCAGEEFRRYELGDVADLDGIDAQRLTSTYQEWITRYPLEMFVSGDIDGQRIRDLLSKVFQDNRHGDYPLNPPPQPVTVGEPRTVEERMDVNQGRLVLGFRHGVTYLDGDMEGMVVMNGVLGSFSHSKLFQNVREKESLAYDASSSLEKTKGLLFITCGIAVENYQKALDIILEQVNALKSGQITEEELVSTRESLLNYLTIMEDNPGELMEVNYVWGLHGREFDLSDYRDRLKAVDRDRIAAAASRLKLDTIYFLRN